jgi:hypothetical protein
VKRTIVFLLGLGFVVVAVAGQFWMRERAMMDSARSVPPKMRMEWLYQHGRMEDRRLRTEDGPATADSGLVLRGKWGRGPAAEVTGKDTLVALTLGSEVALLSFAEPDSPRVLSEIQFPSLTAQSYLEDSLLYTSSNVDLEVWNVADPTRPVKRGQLLGAVGDFWIRDTFLYYIRSDTFHVVSIANSANLRELGSCLESGSVTTGSGNTAVVCQSGGFAFVDVSNPANPHQVSTYPCGRTQFFSAAARGNLVCASYEESGYPYPVRFITLDISTPSSPRLLAKLNNLGGYDIFLDGPLAFVSGRGPWVENPQPFQILSIADSAHPAFIDSCRTTFDYPWAVWEDAGLERAFVAGRYGGLAVVDVHDLNNPVLDTAVLRTGSAIDVHVDGNLCYVTGETDGLRLLDVTDPTHPVYLSGLDTSLFTDALNRSVTAQDSFAFVGWRPPALRIVSVTDPLHPQMVAACSLFNPAEDMVLRDSLLFVAEDSRLEIVNVARPREPRVVGMCALQNASIGLFLQDTLAFVGNWPSPIINISDPSRPDTIANFPMALSGVYVTDTFAYLAASYDSMFIYSIADPIRPTRLGSVDFSGGQQYAEYNLDIEVVDTIAYVGGLHIKTVSIADPRNPHEVGERWLPPATLASKLAYAEPYLYVACSEGGVCILETLRTGISENSRTPAMANVSVTPRITPGRLRVAVSGPSEMLSLKVFDVIGNVVWMETAPLRREVMVNLAGAPDGAYLVMVRTNVGTSTTKVVKTRR